LQNSGSIQIRSNLRDTMEIKASDLECGKLYKIPKPASYRAGSFIPLFDSTSGTDMFVGWYEWNTPFMLLAIKPHQPHSSCYHSSRVFLEILGSSLVCMSVPDVIDFQKFPIVRATDDS